MQELNSKDCFCFMFKVERVDLTAARNLLSEGEGMRVDLRELEDFQGLLETAQVWVQRVREALDEATDEAGLHALENLLQEADNIPVEMVSRGGYLQFEIFMLRLISLRCLNNVALLYKWCILLTQ